MRALSFCVVCLSALTLSSSVWAALPQSWQAVTLTETNQLNAVIYANGRFLAAGDEDTILSSPDGVAWTTTLSRGIVGASVRCAAYGNGRYVFGRSGTSYLFTYSPDGVTWLDVGAPGQFAGINGLTFAYNQFVAVGQIYSGNSPVVTSSDGGNWTAQTTPTTNSLFAVCSAAPDSQIYVAVGANGTILRSTDGVNWAQPNSGTSLGLYAVVYHEGRFIAGGQNGVTVTSTDGINWTPGSPASFEIHGFASSSDAVVAVGSYQGGGHIQASPDGLSWPGNATYIGTGLNGVATGGKIYVAVGQTYVPAGFTGFIAVSATTNAWTKATSGDWQDTSSWSLGVLPDTNQSFVVINNAGFKAVGIGSATTSFPESLTLNNLLIEAPQDSFNQLLLNFAGLNVPLSVENLFVSANGSLSSHYSLLQVTNAYINQGEADFSDNAVANFGSLNIISNANLTLNQAALSADDLSVSLASFAQNGGVLSASNLTLASGTLTQTNGLCFVQQLSFFTTPGAPPFSNANYNLEGGALVTSQVQVGNDSGFPAPGEQGIAIFQQTGGAHTNQQMNVVGYYTYVYDVAPGGQYHLDGGLLVSSGIEVRDGSLFQTGGTNLTQELWVGAFGEINLSGGILVTSNSDVASVPVPTEYSYEFVPGAFEQSGGTHIVQHQLTINGPYHLEGGVLLVTNILIGDTGSRAELECSGGVISNTGVLSISGSAEIVVDGTTNANLGKLLVGGYNFGGAHLTINSPANTPTAVRFLDSSDQVWTKYIAIENWNPVTDHIFFGTNAQGLTSTQLAFVYFAGAPGADSGDIPPVILPTGEIVPQGAGRDGDFTYQQAGSQVIFTGYAGDETNLVIPATLGGLPVTAIGRPATFLANIVSIILPDTVTNIVDQAFAGCSSLQSITLNPGLISIGSSAFLRCSNLTSIAIPDSVVSIGSFAFDYAGLTNIVIGDGMTNLLSNMFANSLNLASVTLGKNVASVDPEAFLDDDHLSSFIVNPDNPFFFSDAGVIFSKDRASIVRYPFAKSGPYTIPATVTNISDSAFYECINLTDVTIPSSVLALGDGAFKNCYSLSNVVIGSSVATIGDYAFYACGLQSVIIPDSVLALGDSSFGFCGSLSNVVIGNNVVTIGDYAFYLCGLQSVTIPDSVLALGYNSFGFCGSLSNVVIGSSVATIGDYAFLECPITNIVIPASVTTLGNGSLFLANIGRALPVYFEGNAPSVPSSDLFSSDITAYYLPGTIGWGTTLAGTATALWQRPNPVILSFEPDFGVQSNAFGFTISWATNRNVIVEAASAPAGSTWSPLVTNALINGVFHFTDNQMFSRPACFYRVRSQ